MEQQTAKAIEIIKGQISKINPEQMHSSKLWTEREVAAGVMADQFVKMMIKKGNLSEMDADNVKNEVKMAALEAAK